MTTFERPLAGLSISLSISESEDSEKYGFPLWQVNRTALQMVSAFFGQGISVVFGHDWRDDGVMEAVYSLAQQMQVPIPLSPEEAEVTNQPLMRNILPWPDEPRLKQAEIEQLASTLRIERAGLPDELRPFEIQALEEKKSPIYFYLRARGLTFLRHKLNQESNARLCIGGRRSGSQGRYPGIIEEALLTVTGHKPLYLAGVLGGATQQIIDAIEGKEMPENFCPSPGNNLVHIYQSPPIRPQNLEYNADCTIDRESVWETFKKVGIKKIAETNGLTQEENKELFHTPVIEEVIKFVLIGLSRLNAESVTR